MFAIRILTLTLQAQTADELVTQGRAFLSASNLTAAHGAFSSAVVVSPTHPDANFFLAATRLLVWPQEPAGSNFLTRLGLPIAGRNVYMWTSEPPFDTNGYPVAPAGVNVNEATAILRTNLLQKLLLSQENFAQITNTNFVVTLTSSEAMGTAVSIDYGDVQMLRALVRTAEFLCYSAYEWNADAKFTAIRSMFEGSLTIQEFLQAHPQVLTFATTNDLGAATTAFLAAVNHYFTASQRIRNRAPEVVRLFNYDPASADSEENFRITLEDMTNSLDNVVTLRVEPDYAVHAGAYFRGRTALRDLLPVFRGSGFLLGTLPDDTFDGLIYGITRGKVEERMANGLGNWIFPVVTISEPFYGAGPQIIFPVNVMRGRGYVVQASTDLALWSDYTAFVALQERYSFTDPDSSVFPRRFYRVVERTGNLPRPINDLFADRIHLSGSNIVVEGYNVSAGVEQGEPWGGNSSVWWSWTAPVSGPVMISAHGSTYEPSVRVYTGDLPGNLTPVGNPFLAAAGTTYHIQVGSWGETGGIRLTISAPPILAVASPPGGAVYKAPANILIQASALDTDGHISLLRIEEGGDLLARTTLAALSHMLTNAGPGYYYFEISAQDNMGVTTRSNLNCTVRPANDAFADRIQITDIQSTSVGFNAAGSREVGEPVHAGSQVNASLWWSWQSSFSGPVTIMADCISSSESLPGVLGVYLGDSVTSLAVVASNNPSIGTRAQVSFTAVAGQTYQIAVDQAPWYWEGGRVELRIRPTQPPTVALLYPPNGTTVNSLFPTNVSVLVSASDNDGVIAGLAVSRDGGYSWVNAALANPSLLVLSNLGFGSHTLVAKATDNFGVSAYSTPVTINVTALQPPNDNFTNRFDLAGANVTMTGNNMAASKEVSEPGYVGYSGGRSVWWTWTAPYTGTFRLSVTSSGSSRPILAVYTGGDFSWLSEVSTVVGYGSTAQLALSSRAGWTYEICLDDAYGSGGVFTFSIAPW